MAGNYIQEMKSRSQKKRESAETTDLARRLAELGGEELVGVASRLGMPDDDRDELLAAVREARRMHSAKGAKGGGAALQRQYRYLGKLLRGVDLEPLRQHLGRADTVREEDAEAFQRLESWRDALVAGDPGGLGAALADIRAALPQADAHWLREAANTARAEAEAGKPPKHARMIFRYLRRLAEAVIDEAQP